MVFIMNREGTIVETVTSPVHQGSNANEILLLAPFASTNTVTVGFKLPNGILIQPRLSESGTGETMTPLEVNNLFLKIGADEESMSAWYIKINRDLTRYSGELGIQFFIYDGAGDILASSYATVTVQKGVAILDGTTFDTNTATQLQEALDKVYAALTAVKTDVSTLQTDMSGAKEEITILKDRMDLAETDIGTLQTDMSVANGEIANLKESKLDKTGGLISGNLDVAGSLFVNGENYDTTVSSLKDRVDLLSTLLFNTIITNTTVEDTYTTRVTAGGLSVVSNTPTTVHKIAGNTKASDNLLNLADKIVSTEIYGVTVTANNNKLTFSGTPSRTSFSYLSSDIDLSDYVGKTLTFSQSPTFTAWNSSGAIFWQVYKDGAPIGNSANTDGTLKVDIENGHAYKARIWQGGSTDAVNETISFMVNEGTTALPYSDYYAGLKSASFKGVTSTGADGESDTSFQLSAARQLRKWDYIDIDNQQLVTGTAEVTQETAFTDEELATYPAGYILSVDRKTIAYPLETPTTAALTVPQTYTAWRNGSETVDTGTTDALPPTITQTYYEEVTA